MGFLSLTRHVKQQLQAHLLTSLRSSVVTNWTSLFVLRNNVKRNRWGTETICTKVLYSNGKKADPGLIYVHRNEDCPWRMYLLLCSLPIHVTCIIYDLSVGSFSKPFNWMFITRYLLGILFSLYVNDTVMMSLMWMCS